MTTNRQNEKKEKVISSIVEGLTPLFSANPQAVYWLSVDFRAIMIATRSRPDESEELANQVLDALLSAIGPEATLVISAFYFDFPRTQIFDPENTPVQSGAFANLLLKKHHKQRVLQPFYSLLAFGKRADELLSRYFERSTGEGSIFEWIIENNAEHISIGHHYAKSFSNVHHAEHVVGVDYRYEKTFSGKLISKGEEADIQACFYVRELETCDFSSITFEAVEHFKKTGMAKTYVLGQGPTMILAYYINTMDAHRAFIADLENKEYRIINYFGPNRENKNVVVPEDSERFYIEELKAQKRQ